MLTHQPPSTTAGPDLTFADNLPDAVAAARDAAAGKYVNVLGADVAKQCLEAGLLDEIVVFVAPVLLGVGTRLFQHAGGVEIRFDPSHRAG